MVSSKDPRLERRLKAIAQMAEADKAKLAGVSLDKWRTLLRAQKRELLLRAVKRER